jgi:chorismate mutase
VKKPKGAGSPPCAFFVGSQRSSPFSKAIVRVLFTVTDLVDEEEIVSNNGQHASDHHGAARLLMCRGVRGAICADSNTKESILARTAELLQAIVAFNSIHVEDIASVFFTTTADLNAEYPAVAARQALGWHNVALMCGQEMNVIGSLPRTIRVLIHWNTTLSSAEIRHVYLGEAVALRPDRKNSTNPESTSQTPITGA